jgi:hypothetical protein
MVEFSSRSNSGAIPRGTPKGLRNCPQRAAMFELNPECIEEIKKYLDRVSEQWDQALAR